MNQKHRDVVFFTDILLIAKFHYYYKTNIAK